MRGKSYVVLPLCMQWQNTHMKHTYTDGDGAMEIRRMEQKVNNLVSLATAVSWIIFMIFCKPEVRSNITIY